MWESMERMRWFRTLRLVCLFAASVTCSASAGTSKEAFISPIRTVIPKHLPRFAFNRDDKPLRVPLVVNVFLGNLDYRAESASVFTAVSASDLETYLMEAFPTHQPACIQTGEKLHVSFDLWYHVAHIEPRMISDLEAAVSRGMKRIIAQAGDESASSQRKDYEYSVAVEGEVLDKMRKIHDMYAPTSAKRYRFDSEDGDAKLQEGSWFNRGGTHSAHDSENTVQTYTIMILNLNKNNVVPEELQGSGENVQDRFSYRYSFQQSSFADSFLGADRCGNP
jgi:hypothetical protein